MNQDSPMTLVFSCPPELESFLPPPIPAVQGLPDWFKAMPSMQFNAVEQKEDQTVKRCPPFLDAMTYGFLILLPCDLKVENGAFSWDMPLPFNNLNNDIRSPIYFHDASQVTGTPYHEEDRFLIKFINFWTVAAPAGYSLLFTHPVNRADLPFTTLTGLVDSDLYIDNRVHFPAHWHDMEFNGILPKGTPVAQCIPVKREVWTMQVATMSAEDAVRARELSHAIAREPGVYRRQFRARKR